MWIMWMSGLHGPHIGAGEAIAQVRVLAREVFEVAAVLRHAVHVHRRAQDHIGTLPLAHSKALGRPRALNSVAMAAPTRPTRSSSQLEASANMQGKAVVVPPLLGSVARKPWEASCIFSAGIWSLPKVLKR